MKPTKNNNNKNWLFVNVKFMGLDITSQLTTTNWKSLNNIWWFMWLDKPFSQSSWENAYLSQDKPKHNKINIFMISIKFHPLLISLPLPSSSSYSYSISCPCSSARFGARCSWTSPLSTQLLDLKGYCNNSHTSKSSPCIWSNHPWQK